MSYPFQTFQTNIPVSLLKSAKRVVTSHSIDGTFDSCPRRFEFMYLWQRATERERSGFAADCGTALHEAVQEWTRYARTPIAKVDPQEAYERGLYMLAKWWPWVAEDYRRENSLSVGLRSIGNAATLYEMTINHPFWDDWELINVEGFGPAIEVPWLIVHESIGTVPTPYGEDAYICTQGKIDWILRHRRTGELRVFDLKTTVKDMRAHEASFKFSGQGPLYSIVLSHALGHDWQANGLWMTYLVSYFGSETDEAPMSVIPKHFQFKPEDIQDGINVKLERLHRMADYARRDYFPRRAHGCDFYGTPCGYLDICESRNNSYIRDWFSFELAKGSMREHKRVYDPVWVIQA